MAGMEARDIEADKALIQTLGGPARVAERLNTTVQVVSNWKKRGIPWQVKVKHPEMFMAPKPVAEQGA